MQAAMPWHGLVVDQLPASVMCDLAGLSGIDVTALHEWGDLSVYSMCIMQRSTSVTTNGSF